MAHINYVVANPNGTFTIKDLQQICAIDGQSVQFVVDDSTNDLTQPTLLYNVATEESNEQNIVPTVVGSQLDQR